MKNWARLLFLLLFGASFLVIVALLATSAAASTTNAAPRVARLADQPPPDGFNVILSGGGVRLFRKDYKKGNPDFVQVANLNEGAALKLLYGDISAPGQGRGVYGGDNPRFQRLSLKNFWQQIVSANNNAFCVVNGGFFYLPDSPTRLAFPMKVDGQLLTDGYGINEYPDQKLMLEIWPDRLDINPLTPEALRASSAPNILGGLTEEANKKGKFALGRTFVGIADTNGDGLNETVFVFSTLTSTQADAAQVLRSFGASKVMMLDGGESTQLICLNKPYIESERLVPQALAVIAANDLAPLKPMQRVDNTQSASWPVLVASEPATVSVQIQNQSEQVWKAGQSELVIENRNQGGVQRYPLQVDAKPGDTVNFTWKTTPASQPGIVKTEWYVSQFGQNLSGTPVQVSLVVIPPELKARQTELEAAIKDWSQQSDTLESNVRSWFQATLPSVAQEEKPAAPATQGLVAAAPPLYSLDDVIVIPLLILPFAGIVYLIVLKVQRGTYVRVYSYEEVNQLPNIYEYDEDESDW
jgi:hypothetical protein